MVSMSFDQSFKGHNRRPARLNICAKPLDWDDLDTEI